MVCCQEIEWVIGQACVCVCVCDVERERKRFSESSHTSSLSPSPQAVEAWGKWGGFLRFQLFLPCVSAAGGIPSAVLSMPVCQSEPGLAAGERTVVHLWEERAGEDVSLRRGVATPPTAATVCPPPPAHPNTGLLDGVRQCKARWCVSTILVYNAVLCNDLFSLSDECWYIYFRNS